jgi:uncharacterized protein DUF3551
MRTLIATTALALAALTAQPALAQTGDSRYCLQSPSGTTQCTFQSMAHCEQSRAPGSPSQCLDRALAQGTVGSGAERDPSPFGGAAPPVGDGGQR